MLACRSWMRHFHGARPRCSSRFLWWCWRASFRSACCLLSCLCFSSSLCTHMQKKCHYFNILQCVRVQSCYMLLSLLTGEDCLLYSDTSLWISIKYEIHLTSLSCLFSSLFFSAALRFSSSLSHCLCSSAAFISAWKVAFFFYCFRTITMCYLSYKTVWWSSQQLLDLLPVAHLPSFSWVLRFSSSAQRVDERGPPWLRREEEGWVFFCGTNSLYSMWRFR